MHPTCIFTTSFLLLATASGSVLKKRTGTCNLLDSSTNFLSFTFTLTGYHRRSGTTPRFLPLFSTSSNTASSTTLSILSTFSIPSFTLTNGVLSTTENTPCYLFLAPDVMIDAQFVCSNDPSLTDPITNELADTTWATGTQCLNSATEIVLLVPVFAGGVRHSKPFYVNEAAGDDGFLKYCVGSCVDAGPLTPLKLEIVSI